MQLGTKISGRYELRELLGDGTLGPCFKGFDAVSGKSFVAKSLPEKFRKQKATVQKFLNHFSKLQQRTHEGFPRILDVGVQDNVPYVIIEYLEGLSLRQLMTARREEGTSFSLEEAESISEEAGQILSWLHQSGYHGSVKPENIYLLPDRIKLADDGLMDVLPPEAFAAIQIRDPNAAPYCAPELLSDPESVGREMDVFGLAAVFYELLAGCPPEAQPDMLRELRPELPTGVEKVVAKGLADDPRSRYPTINTFLLDLARLSDDKHKIAVLEAVVEEEAAAEAERAMAAVRAESTSLDGDDEEILEPASTDKPDSQSEPEKTKLGKVDTKKIPLQESEAERAEVSRLFVDEDLPEKLPDMGIAGATYESASFSSVDEQTDLLSPTPAISSSGGGSKRKMIVVLVLLLIAGGVGAAIYFLGGISGDRVGVAKPGAGSSTPATASKPTDSRLQSVVEASINDVEAKRRQIVEIDSSQEKKNDYISAVELLDDARIALDDLDYDTALQLSRMADKEFNFLLEGVKAASAQARQDAEVAKPPTPPKPTPPKKREVAERAPSKPAEPAAPAARSACPEGMVKIPGGAYMAGSPPEDLLRDPTERELERVDVDTFCMDIFEYPNKKGARPKVSITQTEAEQACASEGKRLCEEEEWEKVCKGPRSNDFPYGKIWDPNVCNTETATGEDRTLAPTGSRSACKSDYGVYDLSGNVLEWTASRFQGSSALAIAKGGSYMRPDYAARCAYRYTAPGNTKDAEIGFRCCANW